MQIAIHTSIEVGYETLGMLIREPEKRVMMVSTTVTPSATLASASMLIQKDIQETMTMR